MLMEGFPDLDLAPEARWERALGPVLAGAAAVTAFVLTWLASGQALTAIAVGLTVAVAGHALVGRRAKPGSPAALAEGTDYSLIGSALGLLREPAALTREDGTMLVANAAYRDRFG